MGVLEVDGEVVTCWGVPLAVCVRDTLYVEKDEIDCKLEGEDVLVELP